MNAKNLTRIVVAAIISMCLFADHQALDRLGAQSLRDEPAPTREGQTQVKQHRRSESHIPSLR